MAEELQIEGKLQVNLIPASSIVIQLGQTKNQLQGEVEDCVILLIAHVWMQKSQEVETKEPLFFALGSLSCHSPNSVFLPLII